MEVEIADEKWQLKDLFKQTDDHYSKKKFIETESRRTICKNFLLLTVCSLITYYKFN